MDDKNNFFCSFCGKRNDIVFTLIAGPHSYICDECINLCSRIIAEKKINAAVKKELERIEQEEKAKCQERSRERWWRIGRDR